MSILIAIGKYGGFYLYKGNDSYRICLGWIAFTLFTYDVEKAIENTLNNE